MDSADMTRLLQQWHSGDPRAMEQLSPVVYQTLKQLARAQMRNERENHTLQPTALVNEAYLKLIDQEFSFADRAHFRGLAARIMRHVLIDHARARRSEKRGNGVESVTMIESQLGGSERAIDMVELDDALKKLAEFDPRKAKVIELSFFGGLTYDEIAEALGVSVNTVDRDLSRGKAWLYREFNQR